MAYAHSYGTGTDAASVVDAAQTFLLARGWTNHDSTTNYTRDLILTSTGENDDTNLYLRLIASSATTINVLTYAYWDASTDSSQGATGSFSATSISTSSTSTPYRFYGDKDMFMVSTDNGSIIGLIYVGLFTPYYSVRTTTDASATAGSSVALSVVDSTGFASGNDYFVFGRDTGGTVRHERVTASSVSSGSITVSSLANNYPSGVAIAEDPFPLVITKLVGNTSNSGYLGTTVTASTTTTGATSTNVTSLVDNQYGTSNPGNRFGDFINQEIYLNGGGEYRGWLKNVVIAQNGAYTVGTAVTIDSVQYMPVTGSSVKIVVRE